MNVTITARGYKAPERLRGYISEKLNRKERVFDGVIDAEVILSYEKQTQVAEFKLRMSNRWIIVKEKSDDIFKSIDLALDNLKRQIKRYKEKRREHNNTKIADKIVA